MRKYRLVLILLTCFLLTSCSSSDRQPFQLEYASGKHVARINIVDYGCIDLRLFDDQAPEAVGEFIRLAEAGAYNNTTINTLIKDYYFACGDRSKDSLVTLPGKQKSSKTLYPFYGSLFTTINNDNTISMADFCLVTSNTEDLLALYDLIEYKDLTPAAYFSKAYGTELSEEELDYYKTYGGAPWLQGHCIVFGQVFDGYEVIDNIMNAMTSEDNIYKPDPDIIISSIEVK